MKSKRIIPSILSTFVLILLTIPASAQIPPEARALELTFQEQERKINDAAFTKYRPEAFANAPHVGTDPWMGSLLKKPSRWKKPSAAAA